MTDLPDFGATRARVEKTDRLVRRAVAACLAFSVVLIVAASVGLGFALQRLHSDVSTLQKRQVAFHAQNVRSDQVLLCQTRVFDQILADLPALVAGTTAPPIKAGEKC